MAISSTIATPQTTGLEIARLRATTVPEQAAKGAMSVAAVDKVAEEFEAQFLSQMMEHMFADVEVDPVFGGGHAEEVYRSFMIDEYGKLMARAGGIGLADQVKQQLLSTQEVKI